MFEALISLGPSSEAIHELFWIENVNDSCSFVQQGPDGEGGAEYSQDVGVPASSAQHPLSGGGLLHSIQMRMKQCNMCTGISPFMLLLCHFIALSPPCS